MKRIAVLLSTVVACFALVSVAPAQLSTSAFRVIGQPDLRRNSYNSVDGSELRNPSGLALDTRGGNQRLYVADFSNHRVLGWADARAFTNGAPADLVLGQPNLRQSSPLGIGNRGFNGPTSLAVNPTTGDLYVADTANNRVLRFVDPFSNVDRVEPEKVYGQTTFNANAANNGGLSGRTMRGPTGLRFDSSGNLWICDTGNHRVLRYSAAALNSDTPEADTVLGQDLFTEGNANSSSNQVTAAGFNAPLSVAFHSDGSLYVADASNARVLVFQAPFNDGEPAVRVIGQPDFTSRSVPPTITASAMRGPNAVFVTAGGDLLVTVQQEHRALIFTGIAAAGPQPAASRALGQALLTSDFVNTGTAPLSSANGLNGPGDIIADPSGNIYIADAGNHRVLAYTAGAAAASRVLGQASFSRNTPNRVGQGSLGPPRGVVVDYSDSQFPVYVADPDNNRVLMWRSTLSYRTGDPADRVIGQADFESAAANADTGRGQTPTATSLSNPRGLAVSPGGDLWVADTNNNRVLRYSRPYEQEGRVRANLVLGQGDFFGSISASVTARSLSLPRGVAIGPNGEIYVSDSGNHRVLEYPENSGNGAQAIRVFGQSDFVTGTPASTTSAQSLNAPIGLHLDPSNLLYVADAGANRVVIYPLSPTGPTTAPSASTVLGQPGFTSNGAAAGPAGLNAPLAVTTDFKGQIIVADTGSNRVLVYPSLLFLPSAGGQATQVLGQGGFGSTNVNNNSPDSLATPQSLFAPSDVFSDRNGTLYVADTGNNRVVHFLKPAAPVSAATFTAGGGVAPGSLISVFGIDLSSETEAATSVPLPKMLAGRVVEVNDEFRAALLFASPSQFNLQLPVETSTDAGLQTLAVRRADTGELLAGGPISVSRVSPGFFTVSQDGLGPALALNQDGSVNGPSNPAARGSVVTLFGTGQGRTNPMIANGEAAPGGPLATTTAQPTTSAQQCAQSGFVCAAIGSKIATVLFSGLAPGFVGLWQLNMQIPSGDDVLTGDAVPVNILLDRSQSNRVTIAIR